MKGSCALPPHPSVSPLFLLPCYSSMLNTSASAFACVAWIYMNVSPPGDNGGQVIDMCRRTQDKQPTPTGVTPACLIHFDWAKTEGWGGGGRAMELGRLKSWDKMTERELFFPPASPDCHKMDPCKCYHTWCLTRQYMWALEQQIDEVSWFFPIIMFILTSKTWAVILIWSSFYFPFVSLEQKDHHHYSPLTLLLLPPCLSVWHGQPPNGLEIHVDKSPSLLLLRLSLSENQNKRWRRHTAPLMATLGSATKVSLNRLVHHFAFVHHDRELCVRQWSFSTLCFYPQMDVPLVGLLLPECIIPLIPWIIFKTRLFIDLCLQCNANWPVFAINITLHALLLPRNYAGGLLPAPVFVLMLAAQCCSICNLN